MSEGVSIQVDFAKPIAVFPLDGVTLLPQQVLPLHIFEPRYRQMVEHALDSSGLIAMAVFADDEWKENYHGRPALRDAVCIGHIAEHERLDDGRYNLILQGVCRARIVQELDPDCERLYRAALLEPLIERKSDAAVLAASRQWVADAFAEGPLGRLTHAERLLPFLENAELPDAAVLELVSFVMATDDNLRYRLLAEPSASKRAAMLRSDLESLVRLLRLAEVQAAVETPKGVSWN